MTPGEIAHEDILTRVEALLAGTTEGAWRFESPYDEDDVGVIRVPDESVVFVAGGYVGFRTAADAAFITASRQLVIDLAAEVRRLRNLLSDGEGGERTGRTVIE